MAAGMEFFDKFHFHIAVVIRSLIKIMETGSRFFPGCIFGRLVFLSFFRPGGSGFFKGGIQTGYVVQRADLVVFPALKNLIRILEACGMGR